jgi:hypothetical protein
VPLGVQQLECNNFIAATTRIEIDGQKVDATQPATALEQAIASTRSRQDNESCQPVRNDAKHDGRSSARHRAVVLPQEQQQRNTQLAAPSVLPDSATLDAQPCDQGIKFLHASHTKTTAAQTSPLSSLPPPPAPAQAKSCDAGPTAEAKSSYKAKLTASQSKQHQPVLCLATLQDEQCRTSTASSGVHRAHLEQAQVLGQVRCWSTCNARPQNATMADLLVHALNSACATAVSAELAGGKCERR